MAETAASYKFQKLVRQVLEDVSKPTPHDAEAACEYVSWVLEHDRLLLVQPTPEVLERIAEIKAAAGRYEDDYYAKHKIYPDIRRWRKSPLPTAD